jgi:tetratricopeptide (TPR) repeat protein
LLGHVYRAQGRQDLAVDAYRRAARALEETDSPDAGAALYYLGEVYQAQDELELAASTFRRAAANLPLESLPLISLGDIRSSQGHHQEALESYRAAVAVTPGCATAHTALANALLATQNRAGAATHYQLAHRLSCSSFQSGTGLWGNADDRLVYDFAANLAEASLQATEANFVKNTEFTIDGVRKRVIFAHPDAKMAFEVYLQESTLLTFDVAVAPESWTQAGDGVTFRVSIAPSAVAAGKTRDTRESTDEKTDVLLTTYIDPKRTKEDRHWHSYSLDLATYAERAVTILFETGAGPDGDSRYDWAGWGAPRLLRQRQDAQGTTPG